MSGIIRQGSIGSLTLFPPLIPHHYRIHPRLFQLILSSFQRIALAHIFIKVHGVAVAEAVGDDEFHSFYIGGFGVGGSGTAAETVQSMKNMYQGQNDSGEAGAGGDFAGRTHM